MLVWEVVEWDEGNEAHATRHGVTVAEIEEVLAGVLVFRPDPASVLRPIAAWEMR